MGYQEASIRCASMLINKGWDIKKLQYWLGHSDTQTTLNIYSHFDKQRLNFLGMGKKSFV